MIVNALLFAEFDRTPVDYGRHAQLGIIKSAAR